MKVKAVYWAVAAVVVLALYLLLNPPTEFVSTNQSDVSRFGPDSLDVQMGMGTFRPDPPSMLAPPRNLKPLLLFPPSEEDLAKLSGPPASLQ